jgi:hypothetical protein
MAEIVHQKTEIEYELTEENQPYYRYSLELLPENKWTAQIG